MECLLSKDGANKHNFCLRCCQGFRSQLAHEKHIALCKNHEPAKVRMPFQNCNILKFRDYAKTMRAPYVAYFDFESIFTKIVATRPNPQQSYTNAQQKHDACSYAYVIIDYDKNIVYHMVKCYENAAYGFVVSLRDSH